MMAARLCPGAARSNSVKSTRGGKGKAEGQLINRNASIDGRVQGKVYFNLGA